MDLHAINWRRIAASFLWSSTLAAQGITGLLVINVTDNQGNPLAGAQIELTSEHLISPRQGTTDQKGVFRAPLLPPGQYDARITLEGYTASKLKATVPLGGSISGNAALKPLATAGVVVEVVASSSKLEKSEVGVTESFLASEVERWPVERKLDDITRLAPAVTLNDNRKTVISGATSYENTFLINGVNINDPYFNNGLDLYVEDAIEETQVMTHAISAEYGGFMGGVINAITKRGGNQFHGSLRNSLKNNEWNAVRPMQPREGIPGQLNRIITLTFGGPIIKDKLWFALAGRYMAQDTNRALPVAGIPYVMGEDEKRWEINLTYQPHPNHTLGLSYTQYLAETTNAPTLIADGITPDTIRDRRYPYSLTSLHYNWVLTPTFNLSLLATAKTQRFEFVANNLGTAFNRSPVFDGNGRLSNNHYFGDDPEDRNNRNVKLVFSTFFEKGGTHDFRFGTEFFEEILKGANQQSPTGYTINASNRTNITLTNWKQVPYTFNEDSTLDDWTVAPGGTFHARNYGLFVQDNWSLNAHWNLSLGMRYEKYVGDRDAGYNGPDIHSWVPRLGANYDLYGDKKWQFFAGYSQYAGKLNAGITTAGTYVCNPVQHQYRYKGEAGNATPTSLPPLGFDLNNYDLTKPVFIWDPKKNVTIDPHLKAPVTHEYTLGLKHQVGATGVFTVCATYRDYQNMFDDFVGEEGTVNLGAPGLDYSIIRLGNVGSLGKRTYKALSLTYEDKTDLLSGSLAYQGNVTFSRLEGNYDSDAGNDPGGRSMIGNYPKSVVNAFPMGRLSVDEPLNIKLMANWTKAIGKVGKITLSPIVRHVSGHPYSLTRRVKIKDADAPYVDVFDLTYYRYYGDRMAGRFPSSTSVDLAIQWESTLKPILKSGAPLPSVIYFIKGIFKNVFNHMQQIRFDVTGATGQSTSSNINNFIIGKPDTFMKPMSQNDYQLGRSVEFQLGFKF